MFAQLLLLTWPSELRAIYDSYQGFSSKGEKDPPHQLSNHLLEHISEEPLQGSGYPRGCLSSTCPALPQVC